MSKEKDKEIKLALKNYGEIIDSETERMQTPTESRIEFRLGFKVGQETERLRTKKEIDKALKIADSRDRSEEVLKKLLFDLGWK